MEVCGGLWAVAWLQERVVQWVQGLVPGEAGRLELEQLELVLIISAMSEQPEAWAEKSNMAKLHKMCTVPQRSLCISFFCITDATNLGPLCVQFLPFSLLKLHQVEWGDTFCNTCGNSVVKRVQQLKPHSG